MFRLRLLLLLAFAAIVGGAFLPWSKSGGFTTNGVGGDGLLTLVLAVAGAAVALLGRRPRAVLITLSAAGLCLLAALIDLADLSRSAGPDVGEGLYVTIAGAAVAAVASALQAFGLLRRQPVVAALDSPEAALGSSDSLG
jgi:hypothetical protein